MSTPEGKIQLAVLKYLKAQGLYCWRNNNGATYDAKLGGYRSNPMSKKGVPDIIGIMPDGRFLGIEVKTPRGKQSVDQAVFEKRSTQLGGIYVLVRSLDDIKSWYTEEVTNKEK